MKCVNCGRERPPDSGTVLKLTESERDLITMSTGETPPLEYFYCQPCYRVITDREMGARLIAGQIEIRLRMMGHPKAQEVAERMYKFLIEKSSQKQVS